MAEVEISSVSRNFDSGGGVTDVSLEIAQGELFVLLGPSGSGKSTLLRLIAGLESPQEGEIRIAGQTGDTRDAVAMVFQNFALYPHMTAFDNIAFPLRLRRVARSEIERRVAEAATLAALNIDLKRRPGNLSGGERQRVALARALIRRPRVILMDEPLSSLDAQLRNRLRIELKDFQSRTGLTLIYVTHDQTEALTLADRMAVMRGGRIEQTGTPAAIYARPANLFVATFVGQPSMSILGGRIRADRIAAGARADIILDDGQVLNAVAPPLPSGTAMAMGIRPEDFASEPGDDTVAIAVNPRRSEFLGGGFLVYASAGSQPLIALLKQAPAGSPILLFIARRALHFFDPAGEQRVES